jgi:hypothetical protein
VGSLRRSPRLSTLSTFTSSVKQRWRDRARAHGRRSPVDTASSYTPNCALNGGLHRFAGTHHQCYDHRRKEAPACMQDDRRLGKALAAPDELGLRMAGGDSAPRCCQVQGQQ